MRIPVDLSRAYRLINHGPVVLAAATAAGRTGVMPAAWLTPLDVSRLAIVISADSFTRETIEASGEFTLSLPPASMAATVHALGNLSGRDVDKVKSFGLKTIAASMIAAPLIEGCLGWLECRLLDEPDLRARHDLLIADVVAAWADDDVFRDGEWHLVEPGRRTIHHVGGRVFLASGARVTAEG